VNMQTTSPRATSYSMEVVVVPVPRSSIPLFRDTYRLLGWTLVNTGPVPTDRDRTTLQITRESPSASRRELARLQERAEQAAREINDLAQQHTRRASTLGVSVAAGGAVLSGVGLYSLMGAFAFIPVLLAVMVLCWWPIGLAVTRISRSAIAAAYRDEVDAHYAVINRCGQAARTLLQ
jgi:hypothetical protein